MFKIFVKYPSFEEEYQIAEKTTAKFDTSVDSVVSTQDILKLQELVRRVPVPPHAINYALNLVRATRVMEGNVPDFVKEWLSWGAGPRAVQYLLIGGKALAALDGRTFVSTDDIRRVAHPVLRHRIITNFNAESQGISTDRVIDRLLETIKPEESAGTVNPQVAGAFKH